MTLSAINNRFFSFLIVLGVLLSVCSCDEDQASFDSSGNSTTGSTAKFLIYEHTIYVISNSSDWESELQVVDISGGNASLIGTIPLNRFLETLFIYNETLFIGTSSGVIFFDISTPQSPIELSTYEHLTACDPVVARDNFAYSTLRSGTGCGGDINSLDIIDITNIRYPQIRESISMENPRGLVIKDDFLLVSEGSYGMSVFDISDPSKAEFITKHNNIIANDIIRDGDFLIAHNESGFTQFSIDTLANLSIISSFRYN